MEIKKTDKANVTNRSSLYLLIGLNLILLLIFGMMELRSYNDVVELEEEDLPMIVDEDVIITERIFEEPPPPVEQMAPPEIPVEIKTVKDDVKLEKPVEIQKQNEDLPPPPTVKGKAAPAPIQPPSLQQKPVIPATVDEKLNRNTVTKAMVYPGCEKFEGNNRELFQCFNQEFKKDLESYLDNEHSLQPGDKPRQITIKFEIDKEGNLEIVGVAAQGSEKEFVDNGSTAFRNLAANLKRKGERGKGIKPALNKNNQPGVLEYSIPVKFAPPLD